MATDTPLPDAGPALDGLTAADVVVGVTACATLEAVIAAAEAAEAAVRRWSPALRVVLVHPHTVDAREWLAGRSAAGAVQLVPSPLSVLGRLPLGPSDVPDLFRPLSDVSARAGARACAVIGTLPEGVTADAVHALVAPVLDSGIDLLCPSYPRHRFDGLINSGIVLPLTRALYGKRVDGQLGIDFGFSIRFLSAIAASQPGRGAGHPIWPVTEAVERGMQVGQVFLGRWLPPVDAATDVSTALTQVLGPLFTDMELHASIWQRTRAAQPVPTFGQVAPGPEEPRAVDVRGMIESFEIGLGNLQDVWGRLLPPATLIELTRLARRPRDQFRMPDRLWARIVFDFALGHRLRTISRDHLLRAMTPVYLAWAASFICELEPADGQAARARVDALCAAFETEKPYLVARWRWPDRFNP